MVSKSHFKFTNSQRNGIFLLALLIVIFQGIYFFVDLPSDEVLHDSEALQKFRHQIDSLKKLSVEKSKSQVFPFNPNYLTDYKGYTLGMSPAEIDRLLEYREKDQWINSATQFQEVTQVSDSLLKAMAPLFKFPEWVTSPKKGMSAGSGQRNTLKSNTQKSDLNFATAQELQKVNGIGPKLSENIVKYRSKFKGGFISDVQLHDVYGLSPEVIERILSEFTVKTPRAFEKIDLNKASKEELVTIQYIDYEIAHYIIEQRTLKDGFKSLEELLKVKNFPANKFEIIKLYLTSIE